MKVGCHGRGILDFICQTILALAFVCLAVCLLNFFFIYSCVCVLVVDGHTGSKRFYFLRYV